MEKKSKVYVSSEDFERGVIFLKIREKGTEVWQIITNEDLEKNEDGLMILLDAGKEYEVVSVRIEEDISLSLHKKSEDFELVVEEGRCVNCGDKIKDCECGWGDVDLPF